MLSTQNKNGSVILIEIIRNNKEYAGTDGIDWFQSELSVSFVGGFTGIAAGLRRREKIKTGDIFGQGRKVYHDKGTDQSGIF